MHTSSNWEKTQSLLERTEVVTKASYLIHSLRCTSTGMGPRVGTRYDDMTIFEKNRIRCSGNVYINYLLNMFY